ncbi:hypothetical protein [Brevibacillus panacihumi]|uniref:hypothetical protein n=1 Tax=Brevibacillus panacihumi TaxID=497735 RepID=UPI000683E842|nr:hypothetical protein [Brevibacillus panacihumi]
MIRLIDNTNPDMAAHILRVQIPAYRVEARLMNFDGIPPLQDTLESIQASAETFLGYFDADDDLAGFLSFEEEQAGYNHLSARGPSGLLPQGDRESIAAPFYE